MIETLNFKGKNRKIITSKSEF